ncbi:unnamed protein product [Rotaria sp. Silwood1]|nr:unnamed protein product [Rotaria sp. Silwood1]CAF1334253.1 unnamed protein product [Rotaria sp. Silwood1]CAF3503664.1 unnamed protein product [Rotaria sp. Silwood1]CAF3560577.1 unnamed protein product [Rotaria sp. Silwood1]CAF4604622.1 unnamed protein product [Rotaria sp. Silwood1]
MSTSPFTIVSLALFGFILNPICMIDICNNKSNGFYTNYTKNNENGAWFSIQLLTIPNKTYYYSCSYLLLLDLQAKECKHYSQVQCGKRFEPKDACDYRHPQIYNSIDKRPCWLTPSCRHKENGLYGHKIQECSSYYERKDKRFVSSIKCPTNMRFSDKYKICLFTLFNCKNKTIYQF